MPNNNLKDLLLQKILKKMNNNLEQYAAFSKEMMFSPLYKYMYDRDWFISKEAVYEDVLSDIHSKLKQEKYTQVKNDIQFLAYVYKQTAFKAALFKVDAFKFHDDIANAFVLCKWLDLKHVLLLPYQNFDVQFSVYALSLDDESYEKMYNEIIQIDTLLKHMEINQLSILKMNNNELINYVQPILNWKNPYI